MGFTYNITFVVSPEREEEFIKFIKDRLFNVLKEKAERSENISLKKVEEAGGEKPDPQHGTSIALSISFPEIESAYHWRETRMAEALSLILSTYGQEVLYFDTLLRDLV